MMNTSYITDLTPLERYMKKLDCMSETVEKMKSSLQTLEKHNEELLKWKNGLTMTLTKPTPEPPKCTYCRDRGHWYGECPYLSMMRDTFGIGRLPGFFVLNDWLIAFPMGKYPILVGKSLLQLDRRVPIDLELFKEKIRKLTFVDGVTYSGLSSDNPIRKFEFLTEHEFSVIEEHDPELAKTIVQLGLW